MSDRALDPQSFVRRRGACTFRLGYYIVKHCIVYNSSIVQYVIHTLSLCFVSANTFLYCMMYLPEIFRTIKDDAEQMLRVCRIVISTEHVQRSGDLVD